MPSLETSGRPNRSAVAAIRRSAVVLALSKSVARVGACGSEPGVGEDEFGSRVDDLDAPELGLELEHAGLAPAATQRAVPNLSLGLE